MRKFIHKITPSFIRSFNEQLLKNAPLGWQLQLPTITWLWFLVTVLTLPIPFLISLDNSGADDTIAVILIAVLTGVLEAFLFVYILIQFNATKSFGKRVFLNGFKEQLAYFYVFMLCMMHIVLYPLIIDIRKGNLMSPEEIRNEAVVYNKAVFYFMGKPEDYRYFPTEATFLKYKHYSQNNNNPNGDSKERYYIEDVKPMMQPYFKADSESIDMRWTRDIEKCPKLYCIQSNNLTEVYDDRSYFRYYDYYDEEAENNVNADPIYFERYQLQKKTDAEHIKDIQNLLDLYFKYHGKTQYTHIDSATSIYEKYKTNQFIPVMYDTAYNYDEEYAVVDIEGNAEVNKAYATLSPYTISRVHGTISRAQNNKTENVMMRLLITFHVALCLAVLLFLFKNTRLRDFILMFVYSALLALAVIILTVVFRGNEGFGLHVIWIIFLFGIYFTFFQTKPTQYSSVKTILVQLSNATFAYAPIFIFLYFHEYLDMGKLNEEVNCSITPDICSEHYARIDLIQYSCLWGGNVFYLLIGSTLYKKVYERIGALPFAK